MELTTEQFKEIKQLLATSLQPIPWDINSGIGKYADRFVVSQPDIEPP